MTVKATAWKTTLDKRSEECKYQIQITVDDGRVERKIEGMFEDWNSSGYGTHGSGSVMMLYSKDFGDAKKWLNWAKQFPYYLEELTQSDKIKVLSWGRSEEEPKGKRRCRKCGNFGHNQKTCGKKKEPKLTGKKKRKKRVEKGPRKCGNCGESGHNSKTCNV